MLLMSTEMRFKVMGLDDMAWGENVFGEEQGQSPEHPASRGQERKGIQWARGQSLMSGGEAFCERGNGQQCAWKQDPLRDPEAEEGAAPGRKEAAEVTEALRESITLIRSAGFFPHVITHRLQAGRPCFPFGTVKSVETSDVAAASPASLGSRSGGHT